MQSLAVFNFISGTLVSGMYAAFILVPNRLIPTEAIQAAGSLAHISIYCSRWHLAVMSAVKCYIIVSSLTSAGVLTIRFKLVVIAAIWIANTLMVSSPTRPECDGRSMFRRRARVMLFEKKVQLDYGYEVTKLVLKMVVRVSEIVLY